MELRKTYRRRSQLRALLLGLCLGWPLLSAAPLLADDDSTPVLPASPEQLVERLKRTFSSVPRDEAVEDALVAHGAAALPALEQVLALHLRGRERQAFIDSRASKGVAAVRVLARIPGTRSTDLLIRTLGVQAENFHMRDTNLRAVEKRTLSHKQLTVLLGYSRPEPVLLALRRIGSAPLEHALRTSVERIHDRDVAAKQLRNRNGYPTALPGNLWELRLQSGRVLGRDMLPEMRKRAGALVAQLRSLVAERDKETGIATDHETATWEGRIATALTALHALGTPVQGSVQEAAQGVTGAAGALLDMARLVVGEQARLEAVTKTLARSTDGSLRHLAMIVLARVQDPRSMPALFAALHDPLHRESQTCLPPPGGDSRWYPIREKAARALIEMGADKEEVRRRSPRPVGR